MKNGETISTKEYENEEDKKFFDRLEKDCMIVNEMEWLGDWEGEGLVGDSFVLCGDAADKFMDEMKNMIKTRQHADKKLRTPHEFYNAFESIIDDYRSLNAPDMIYQTMKHTVTEGTYTWEQVELEGQINGMYTE